MNVAKPPLASWGLDPLYMSFRKLLISSIVNKVIINERNKLYEMLYCNRPIKKVEIVGTVIRKRVTSKKVQLEVDDGTGVIECFKYFEEGDGIVPLQNVHLGSVIMLKGTLGVRESAIVIQVKNAEVIEDPNIELHHKISAIYLHKTLYSQPFLYSGPKLTLLDENPFLACTCGSIITSSQYLSFPSQEVINAVKVNCLFCRCNMSVCSEDSIGFFRIIIVNHMLKIQETHQYLFTHSFNGIMKNSDLRIVAKKYIVDKSILKYEKAGGMYSMLQSNDGNHDVKDIEVDELIRRCIESLCSDGVIWVRDSESIILVTVNGVLMPALKEALEQMSVNRSREAGENREGWEDEVFALVRRRVPVTGLPRFRILECWKMHLLEQYTD